MSELFFIDEPTVGARFIVMDASAHMPSTCKGKYRRVAVVETNGTRPKFIGERAKGCVKIIKRWEGLHAEGKNTAYSRALVEAYALADKLNGIPPDDD